MDHVFQIHKKFRNRLLRYLVLAILCPTVFLIYVGYNGVVTTINQLLTQNLQSISDEVAERAQTWRQKDVTLLTFLVNEFQTKNLSRAEKERLFRHMVAADPVIYGIHSIGPDGWNLARNDDRPFVNYSNRLYFQKALSGVYYSEAVVSKSYQRPTVCTAAPVRHFEKITEVIAMCTYIDTFSKAIGATAIGNTGYVFVVDDQGRVIGHPHVPYLEPLQNTLELKPLQAYREGRLARFDYEHDKQQYISYITPTVNNWVVVAIQDKSEMLAEARRDLTTPLVVALLMVGLGMWLTYFVVEKSTKPLHDLAKAVNELGRQNFKARVHINTQDELKLLAMSFNGMAERIEAHTNDLSQKVAQISQQLVYSAKMSSLGEMASGVAHEINNPLAIISIQIQSLKMKAERGGIDPKKCLEALDKIEDTCARITQIIKGLSNFSRDASEDPMRVTNLREILADTKDLCSESLRRIGVSMNLECDPNLTLECQPVPISQVLVNLIMNSKDAIRNLDQKWIRVQASERDEKILIQVTDSGSGIPQKISEKMMQPFFTTKGVGEGTGLGLAISKGIVEQHQGKIWYNPDSFHTEFCISLPKAQKKAEKRNVSEINSIITGNL